LIKPEMEKRNKIAQMQFLDLKEIAQKALILALCY